ncbi:MAG: lipid-A-disaccharide synthase [Bacteroidaceae bacterium]|nr:lipid-A-disaccharide synthase [Bacteroidaceae bacterium]
MKYFFIAGEASGDLHAANLMRAILEKDSNAQFQYYGGNHMQAVANGCLRHYKEIAYMGFIPVLRHLPTILRAMKECRHSIESWKPDVLILVDYPGFNLSIAKYIRQNTSIPVYYYILPKAWAWKEGRVKALQRNTDERFSILPFEVPFFEEKHHCPIHYIGNPSVDEVTAFKAQYHQSFPSFCQEHQLPHKPLIALLPGSRMQEIKDNYRPMVEAARPLLKEGYQMVVAAAPNIPTDYYLSRLKGIPHSEKPTLLSGKTFELLTHSEAALVTSGTATLETALFNVPQVVCYYAPMGRIVRAIKPHFLHVPYISLVNLILDQELIPELIGDQVNPTFIRSHLRPMLAHGNARPTVLAGYQLMQQQLGQAGAPQHAAQLIQQLLQEK